MLSNYLSVGTAEQLNAAPDNLSVTQFSGSTSSTTLLPCSRVALLDGQLDPLNGQTALRCGERRARSPKRALVAIANGVVRLICNLWPTRHP